MPVTDTWTLNQHNIYILPTRGGWAFGLTLLVMLVASINYPLNLGYVLTFLLAGSKCSNFCKLGNATHKRFGVEVK